MANQLSKASSIYLRQHQDNPVHWMEWGQEALELAKKLNRPIFLSIGYSSCHWCHVMEKESFSQKEVADFLNAHFVSIKVDREERPDIDHIYMKAVQAMTGQGGWPLNVFLTPDLRPFYGGTYYAPDRRYKRPGFMEVLERIHEVYHSQFEEVRKSADSLTNYLFQTGRYFESKAYSSDLYSKVLTNLERLYDSKFGGFGPAPKFFYTDGLKLFLYAFQDLENSFFWEAAQNTLDQMSRGGVYDHLAGGFHRYSTDEAWQLPHFEKMLYDNALLCETYALASTLSENPNYLSVAENIADWVIREMKSEKSLFFSAQDADSEGEEGRYYMWSEDELEEVLGKQNPDFSLSASPGALMAKKPIEELSKDSIEKLLKRRETRKPPQKDTKIQTSWNALFLSALCFLSKVSSRGEFYKDQAISSGDALWKAAWKDEQLVHVIYDKATSSTAFLEDYAYFGKACLDLFYLTKEPRFFERACQLGDILWSEFYDQEAGGFWSTSGGHSDLLLRVKDVHDGALPSSFALAVSFFHSLSILKADEKLAKAALKSFESILGSAEDQPGGFSSLALISKQFEDEKFIVGEKDPELKPGLGWVQYLPLINHPDLKITKEKKFEAGLYLVCDSSSCQKLSMEQIHQQFSNPVGKKASLRSGNS